MNPEAHPDFYLVLAGPKSGPISSRGTIRPWVISSVFLFEAEELVNALGGARIGIATSVRRQLWNDAEIYPEQRTMRLLLSPEQRALLAHFAPVAP